MPVEQEIPKDKVDFTKDFKHSGLNYSKRRAIVVVENNAIRDGTIRPLTSKTLRSSSQVSTAQLHLTEFFS